MDNQERIAGLLNGYRDEIRAKSPQSLAIWQKNRTVMPGGVGSMFRLADPFPMVVKRARGARLWDADDNEYLDFMLGFSVLILGNAPDEVQAAIREALPFKGVVAVVGGGTDKGLPSLVSAVAGLTDGVRFVFTRPATHPRAADPKALERAIPRAVAADDLPAALAIARRKAGRRDLLLVTGSLYLAGEALSLLSGSSSVAGSSSRSGGR